MIADKICQACGRPMAYRKKWAKVWDDVRYCSKACRGKGVPAALMARIEALLSQREPGKTICPSEVLQAQDKKNPIKMERVRDAARLLAERDVIEITQRGRVIDPHRFKGPIRLRKKR